MMPIVNGLRTEFKASEVGPVSVVELNAGIPANAALQAQYGLRGHPTFVVLDSNDRVVQQFFGPQTEVALREAITAAIEQ